MGVLRLGPSMADLRRQPHGMRCSRSHSTCHVAVGGGGPGGTWALEEVPHAPPAGARLPAGEGLSVGALFASFVTPLGYGLTWLHLIEEHLPLQVARSPVPPSPLLLLQQQQQLLLVEFRKRRRRRRPSSRSGVRSQTSYQNASPLDLLECVSSTSLFLRHYRSHHLAEDDASRSDLWLAGCLVAL